MEEEEGMPLFWLQNNNRHRRLRRTSSLLLNSGFLLIFLLAIAFIIIFIVIPSFLSFTSKIFRPQSVKKSWDSLNLVLVLFAIICGFLSRTNNSNDNSNINGSTSSYEDYKFANTSQDVQKSNPSTPHKWYEHSSDRTAYNTLLQRQRSSSYPDLRQESSWVTSDDRWRSYDDTHVNNYRFLTSDQLHHRRPKQDIEEEEGVASSKDISVDTFVSQGKEVPYRSPPPSAPLPPLSPSPLPPQRSSLPPPPSPPPLPPQLQPKVVRRKEKRTYQDLTPKERPENKNLDIKKYQLPPPSPPPQPPPPPPPPPLFSKNEKKRGGASATKEFLTSLRRKKKKQRQKSVENLESLFNPEPSSALSLYPPPSPPPPPPPPPPPFFQNLFFSKKGKNKKVHSVPPPPPLPPPLVSEARASKTKVQNTQVTTHKPTLPVKISNYNRVEENVNTGNESPLYIPTPPPLPSFKMPELKFVVHGDYVRIKSNNSSRSVSPDLDGVDDQMSKATSPSDGGDSPMSPLFCPSPDVDTKADNFIARVRAGLRLEKMNSVRGRSNLGLQASSSQDTEEGEGPS